MNSFYSIFQSLPPTGLVFELFSGFEVLFVLIRLKSSSKTLNPNRSNATLWKIDLHVCRYAFFSCFCSRG